MQKNMESVIESQKFKDLLDEAISRRLAQFVRQQEEKAREVSLIERMVRVEEAIQAQQKVMEALQREMNARFEASDKRFDSMEKRFTFLQWVVIGGFAFLSFLITVINLVKQ